jgi:hypothetical protein
VRRLALVSVAAAASLSLTAPAGAQTPIPQTPSDAPAFVGAPARQAPLATPPSPRHPFMAANGSSNLHEDGWQTDASWRAGPLGRDVSVTSTFFARDCGSVTFDRRGRIVSVCVGITNPLLVLLDPRTLATLASMDLPLRDPGVGLNPFQGFAGGGYFYLDERDRAVIPTTTRHVFVVRQDGTGFAVERDLDLTGAVPSGDAIISALPDWHGRLWFASRKGVLGTVDPRSGAVRAVRVEAIGNSFAVAEDGDVYVVSDAALYRFTAGPDGTPRQRWRRVYDNTGEQKPGQTQPGSGTTPTLMARGLVAITDNADPMNVVVLTRAGRRVCTVPVFGKGASATDQSLIAAGRSLVVENNYGYSGPLATELGGTTTPGLERVDVDRDLRGCSKVWSSDEIAPSVVPKVSVPNGLVYTYTKPPGQGTSDPWYLTAIDFRTGRTVFKALAGNGLGYNNNYAPVTIGPDGTAYVGTLGGLVALRDASPPPQPAQRASPRLDLRARCRTARLAGPDVDWVRSVRFTPGGGDASWPFAARLPRGSRRVRAVVTLTDGSRLARSARVAPCGRSGG